jgi:hypothetical protein
MIIYALPPRMAPHPELGLKPCLTCGHDPILSASQRVQEWGHAGRSA